MLLICKTILCFSRDVRRAGRVLMNLEVSVWKLTSETVEQMKVLRTFFVGKP